MPKNKYNTCKDIMDGSITFLTMDVNGNERTIASFYSIHDKTTRIDSHALATKVKDLLNETSRAKGVWPR